MTDSGNQFPVKVAISSTTCVTLAAVRLPVPGHTDSVWRHGCFGGVGLNGTQHLLREKQLSAKPK